jgi:prephenate dehydrogenase
MKTRNSLSECHIAIVGLGLMGGSLALALREKCASVLGSDRDPAVIGMACRRRIIDRADTQLQAILPQAHMIILALPVRGIIEMIPRLPGMCPEGAIVMDLGSTKVEVLQAMEGLPPEFDPIGGHPICGKETSGLANASPELFRGSPFILSKLARTSDHAIALSMELVRAVGGSPFMLDAQFHDDRVAYTSHLPYLLSLGLVQSLPPEALPLIGSGFRVASRLAGSNPEMMTDIFMTNRESVLEALARFRAEMDAIEAEIRKGDPQSLKATLAASADRYHEFIAQREEG